MKEVPHATHLLSDKGVENKFSNIQERFDPHGKEIHHQVSY